jgi:NAD+ synthase
LLPQGQDKFFFVLPYEKMDACIYGELHGIPPEEVAEVIGLRVGSYFLLWENPLLYAGKSADIVELVFIA